MGMKKNTKTSTVKVSIKNQFEPFRRGFTHDSPLYEKLISDFDEYIEYVSKANSETYLKHRDLALESLRVITRPVDPLSNAVELNHSDSTQIVLWDSKNLLEIAETENWFYLNEQIEKHGSLFAYFAYFAVFMLNNIRWDIDLVTYKFKDPLLIKEADNIIFGSQTEDSRKKNIELIKEAQLRLNKFARNTFNKNRPHNKKHPKDIFKKITDPEEFTVYTIEAVINTVPDNLRDLMLMGEQGDKSIPYIPNRAANQYTKAIPGHSDIYNYANKVSLDAPILNKKSKRRKVTYLDSISVKDISQINQIHNVVRTTKILAGITGPLDKEIVQLLLKGFTVREIADKLSTPKSTVYDHIIKLTPHDQD